MPRFQQTFSSGDDGWKARLLWVRRMWWYQTVSAHLGLDAPHGLGKAITPERYRIDGVSHVYRSDWSLYARGLRSPSTSTLSQVDRLAPGASAIFSHPLWCILRMSRDSGRALALFDSGGCIKVDFAFQASPLDAVARLLHARQVSLKFGDASTAKQAEISLLRVCIVCAAVDSSGLPFVNLIGLLNCWISRHSPTSWPFFSVTAFSECVQAIRQCKPRKGSSFLQAAEASRRKTAASALKGKYGIDITLVAQPIFLCNCSSKCIHEVEARRSRAHIAKGLQSIKARNRCDLATSVP